MVRTVTGELKRKQIYTSASFKTAVLSQLKGTSVDVLFIIDSCCSYAAVKQHNHSLLAACGAHEKAKDDTTGLTSNLMYLLTTILADSYYTLGELHAALIHRVTTGELAKHPVWQSGFEKTKEDGAIVLMPMLLPEASSNRQGRNKENIKHLQKRERGITVNLTIHLRHATDESVRRIMRWFKRIPVSNDVVIACDLGLGRYNWARHGGSTWLSLEVDVIVWHEMPPNDAIVFNSGPFSSELSWDRDAPLVEMSMGEAEADLGSEVPRYTPHH